MSIYIHLGKGGEGGFGNMYHTYTYMEGQQRREISHIYIHSHTPRVHYIHTGFGYKEIQVTPERALCDVGRGTCLIGNLLDYKEAPLI